MSRITTDQGAVGGDRAVGGKIVVGIDGSKAARRALDWALREAELRHATLEIVSVWEDPYRYWGERMPTAEIEREERTALQVTDRLLDEALGEARTRQLDVVLEAASLEGSPAGRLVERSTGASLLVVGSRGRGGFAGLILGSVSQQCIAHARCPVVVVRGPGQDETENPGAEDPRP